MHAHVAVHTRAIETDVQAKGNAGPRRIASFAVKACLEARSAVMTTYPTNIRYLISLACFEDLEYLVRLCFRGFRHGVMKAGLKWVMLNADGIR
jgi:hypothetical protein